MGSVTLFTASRMQAIEDGTVTSGLVDMYGHLILTHHDGSTIDAGNVKGDKGDPGAPGATGPAGLDVDIAAGFVQVYVGSTPPPGWMFCTGAAISRTTYAELFSVIGTTFGIGDGSTTFNLPDYRGRAIFGMDSSQSEFSTLGKTGGSKTHTIAFADLPPYVAPTGTTATGFTSAPTNAGSTYGFWYKDTNAVPFSTLNPYSVSNFIISLGINGPVGGGTSITVNYRTQGSTAERDALYGIPGTDAQRVALANQKPVWYNTDLGWEESYYATSGLSGLSVLGLDGGIASDWFPSGHGITPSCVLEPTATFGATPSSNVGGWNGTISRVGGSTWFGTNGYFITLNKPGIYDLSYWTIMVTGSGQPDLYLRLTETDGSTVYLTSNGDTPPLTSVFTIAKHAITDVLVPSAKRLYCWTVSGTFATHQVTANGTALTKRGQLVARYVRPPLVTS